MKELVNRLLNTTGMIQIHVQAAGLELTLHNTIEVDDRYEDGFNIILPGEGNEIFINTLTDEIISYKKDEDEIEYIIRTLNNTLVSILI